MQNCSYIGQEKTSAQSGNVFYVIVAVSFFSISKIVGQLRHLIIFIIITNHSCFGDFSSSSVVQILLSLLSCRCRFPLQNSINGNKAVERRYILLSCHQFQYHQWQMMGTLFLLVSNYSLVLLRTYSDCLCLHNI